MPAKLSPSLRALLAAFVAANGSDSGSTRRALQRARRAGLGAEAAREAMRMVHLFGGFPRAINALEAWHAAYGAGSKVSPRRDGPTGGGASPVDLSRGDRIFASIYGSSAAAVRAFLTKLDEPLATWIREHAYGRVLTRRALKTKERELLAVAALAFTGQEKQLVSHARGAMRCGASPAQVQEAAKIGARTAPDTTRKRIRKIVGNAVSVARP